MGWPRKNEEMRIYKDKEGAYCLIFLDTAHNGKWDAIANVYEGKSPSLCGTMISREWIAHTWPKRMQWDELPLNWQEAFRSYMSPMFDDDPPFEPEKIRGLWRVGCQPVVAL